MRASKKINKKAFTVLELLVVLALIVILSSITLSATHVARMRGRDTGRVVTIKEIRGALEQYRLTYGEYPQCLTPAGFCTSDAALSSSPFMKNVPNDPRGYPYAYAAYADVHRSTPCTGYHIGSSLEERNSVNLRYDTDLTTSNIPLCGNSSLDFTGLSYPNKGADNLSCQGGGVGIAVPSANPSTAETCYDFINP